MKSHRFGGEISVHVGGIVVDPMMTRGVTVEVPFSQIEFENEFTVMHPSGVEIKGRTYLFDVPPPCPVDGVPCSL
jgi:hypothetical protein